jgi:hypothetical protein
MKCGHPACNRGIGLVSHRCGWFNNRLYCSKACRDNYASPSRPPVEPRASVVLAAVPVRNIVQAR